MAVVAKREDRRAPRRGGAGDRHWLDDGDLQRGVRGHAQAAAVPRRRPLRGAVQRGDQRSRALRLAAGRGCADLSRARGRIRRLRVVPRGRQEPDVRGPAASHPGSGDHGVTGPRTWGRSHARPVVSRRQQRRDFERALAAPGSRPGDRRERAHARRPRLHRGRRDARGIPPARRGHHHLGWIPHRRLDAARPARIRRGLFRVRAPQARDHVCRSRGRRETCRRADRGGRSRQSSRLYGPAVRPSRDRHQRTFARRSCCCSRRPGCCF